MGFGWLSRFRYKQKMRRDWDRRARENTRHYILDGQPEWSEEDFFKSGEAQVEADILTDMHNICQGRPPETMRILEIGCGAGRMTRALARVFGEVHGVDVSGEMIRQARMALASLPNVRLYQNNGVDLSVLGDQVFDFAYSTAVFHHIARRDVIEGYVREVHRVLRPGALFKFEVQGSTEMIDHPGDTWLGASFTERQAAEMGLRCGFDPRYTYGAGEERFWLWFFKWP